MVGRLVTPEGLAAELSLKPRTIREWALKGKIPCLRISPKVLRFDLDEVLASLKSGASINNTIPPVTSDIEGHAGTLQHETNTRATST